ncbi:hypothetical protein K504DRAFT_448124 [Pleomassaria siparia CBS 279.74]|uniref:Uncharacterized protein n=1 Tax=Pleomassaria siparia CBS 279.74 TaxID=1314801 RepID=A0A6G1K130_9PLEO|nr:hypothetical protein K504DRAFT_448124 [Pleomassaria siparia CBS 279.74]
MGQEIKTLHASYQTIRPCLLQPSSFISNDGIELVRNIFDGVETICEDLLEDVQSFTEQLERAKRVNGKRFSPFFALHSVKPITRDRNKRVLAFFEEHNYALERCQLRYGNMLLNLMLAVFVYSQCIHDTTQTPVFIDTSTYLITDLHATSMELRSRERREKRARKTNRLPVEASWWWHGLPPNPPHLKPLSPLAVLSRIWVNPEARIAARRSPNIQEFQQEIKQLRELTIERERNTVQLDAENQQLSVLNQRLTSDNIQLQQDNEKVKTETGSLKKAIDRLQHNISRLINELQTERDARREQEQHTNHYRERHDAVHRQYAALVAQNERADRHAEHARKLPVELPPEPRRCSRGRNQLHHCEPNTQDVPPDFSQPRTLSRRKSGPPVAYGNQKRGRRHSSSSCQRSDRPSDRWSRTSTAVEEPNTHSRRTSSSKAPPISTRTKLFRTGF